MKRWGWLLGAVFLVVESVVVYQEYPRAKPWMRAGYVWLWTTANTLAGHDFPVPDRFK